MEFGLKKSLRCLGSQIMEVSIRMLDVTMGEDKSHACVQQQTCCHGKHEHITPPGLSFLVYEMGIKEKLSDDRHKNHLISSNLLDAIYKSYFKFLKTPSDSCKSMARWKQFLTKSKFYVTSFLTAKSLRNSVSRLTQESEYQMTLLNRKR